ncbi:MAG TPA: hypothetical protein VNU72_02475 [Puia sp.]|jgi:hypothetical protein|nr:hypothetical protein [Puia sp.]
MLKILAFCWVALLCLTRTVSYAQSTDSVTDKLVNFPSRLFGKVQSATTGLNQQLTRQTEKCLAKMQRREDRIRKKMFAIDSAAARSLFPSSAQQSTAQSYSGLAQKLRTDTGSRTQPLNGEYQPYVDSLRGSLLFLQQNPSLLTGAGLNLSPQVQAQLQASVSQLQALRARLQDADQIKTYVQQRKQEIGQYIARHTDLQSLLGKEYAGMNHDLYYYSQQVRQYKDILNNPDQLEQKAFSLLNRLPAFQDFMKNNSELAGLFSIPGSYGATQGLDGLQTRDQVSQLVQNQLSSAGDGGAAALQSSLQSAGAQLDNFKSKLSQLGTGNGNMDMPDFKPNDQKTKTFWKRLQYGTNFQTSHNNYYFPIVTDLGLSLGYRLGHANTIGIGASYKIGWGNGINDIAITSQGVGLRSFLDIHIKGSFSATGGLEYNYTTPFTSYRQLPQLQYWTQSGLIGITKTISMKNRVFRNTQLQLLWDMLSYQQVPKTQPFLFRLGYNF